MPENLSPITTPMPDTDIDTPPDLFTTTITSSQQAQPNHIYASKANGTAEMTMTSLCGLRTIEHDQTIPLFDADIAIFCQTCLRVYRARYPNAE